MNVRVLQLFIHLCESRNFSQTANAMHISPSALSRQIQKLEQETHQTLFIRDNRRVTLTRAGEQFLTVANNMLSEWLGFQKRFSPQEAHLKGELKFFCSVTASYSHLPALLSNFRLQNPFIELKLVTGDPAQSIVMVLKNKTDIAITAKPQQLPKSIKFTPIDQVSMSLIAPKQHPSLYGDFKKKSMDWLSAPFILPSAGTARERVDAWFSKMNLTPEIYAQVGGHEAIVSMVALGLGIGIAPDVVIENSPVKKQIQRLRWIHIEPLELGICCLQQKHDDPLIQAFWKIIDKTG